MTAAVHQVLPVLARRDATGHHTLEVQRLLREQGMASEIFVLNEVEDTASLAHPLRDFDARAGHGATVLYQCSVGSDLGPWCLARPEPLVLDYHNMTPAPFYDAWHPLLATALREGRRQLAELAGRTTLALADSAYNAAELDRLGYRRTVVAPLIIDLDGFDEPPDAAALERLEAGRAPGAFEWLCVGRIVPNKAQHRLLAAFATWASVTGRPGRLHLVGGGPTPAYEEACRRLADRLGVADRVVFAGSVTHAELVAHYRFADAFVSLSRHEGFCVPVVEAMHLGLPVVALAAGAVPETAADAAVLLARDDPLDVAAAVERLAADPVLRAALAARGHDRSADFHPSATRPQFLAALGGLS